MASYKIDTINEVFDLGRYINSKQSKGRLTMIQLRTVMYISQKGTVKPTDIAKQFAITPASVTSQIDNLVEEGWLERVYNQDDKRVIEVTLTERGKEELKKEIGTQQKSFSDIFDVLNQEEQKQLLELVRKVNKSIRA